MVTSLLNCCHMADGYYLRPTELHLQPLSLSPPALLYLIFLNHSLSLFLSPTSPAKMSFWIFLSLCPVITMSEARQAGREMKKKKPSWLSDSSVRRHVTMVSKFSVFHFLLAGSNKKHWQWGITSRLYSNCVRAWCQLTKNFFLKNSTKHLTAIQKRIIRPCCPGALPEKWCLTKLTHLGNK